MAAARAAIDAGDRVTALAEVAEALKLDREFLAANAMRDRIREMDAAPRRASPPHRRPVPTRCSSSARSRRRVDRRPTRRAPRSSSGGLEAAAAALDEVRRASIRACRSSPP
jgi:hypothetical protein